MSRERLKGIVIGFIMCAVLSTSILVLGNPQTVTREITYGVSVSLNGQVMQFSEDDRPFVMAGRTFLPVRAIADAVGLAVDFDPAANRVYLGDRFAGQRRPLQQAAPFFDSGRTGQDGNVGSSSVAAQNAVMMGNASHDNAIVFNSGLRNIVATRPGGTFTLHNLDGQFRMLTGQVGRVDGTGMLDATLEITGDGTVLRTIELSATGMPTSFEVFVEGVRQLRIDVRYPDAATSGIGGRAAYAVVAFVE